uniref:Methyltransferase FkbM family n=1 Tax=Caulobacter sp. (strain K31) TaxID=366602 RepID=B0T6Y9_CAUSK
MRHVDAVGGVLPRLSVETVSRVFGTGGQAFGRRSEAPAHRSAPPFDLRRLNDAPLARAEAAIRGLCASAYLGDDTALCRVLGRYKMFVDTRDDDLSAHLLLDGYWEIWVTRVMADLVKPGMVCVDVGAHLGYYTLLMADLVGTSGRVHAFEPNPALRERLSRSVRANGFEPTVNAHAWPLFDQDDLPVRLIVPPRRPGGGHVALIDPAVDDGGLRARRLDGFAEIPHVDVVKIDAEGSELAIWRGMERLLGQGRPMSVILEFTSVRYADPGGFLDQFVGAGFSLALADPRSGLRAVTKTEVLAASAVEDQMLVLRR